MLQRTWRQNYLFSEHFSTIISEMPEAELSIYEEEKNNSQSPLSFSFKIISEMPLLFSL